MRRSCWAAILHITTIAIGVGGLRAALAMVGAVVLCPLPFEDRGTGDDRRHLFPRLQYLDVDSSRPRLARLQSHAYLVRWHRAMNSRLSRSRENKILHGAAVHGGLFACVGDWSHS